MAKMNLSKLTEDLKACREEAVKVLVEFTDDSGTCNFDSPALAGPKRLTPTLETAIKAAGMSCFYSRYHGVVLGIGLGGQGYTRTKAAEAFEKALRARGYETSMYYQMD